MTHTFTKRSEVEENILKTLFNYDVRGLCRQQIAKEIEEKDISKVARLLESLKQIAFISESLVMVLDGQNPDDVSVWFIADTGKDYLREYDLI